MVLERWRAARARRLLVGLVGVWAASWPAIKIGVASVPPLWYASLRYATAAVCLFAFVGWQRLLACPPRRDWPLVAVSAILQMATYSALTAVALSRLPAGRASVLAFSTPLWVVPLAAWRLRERISRATLVGVCAGLAGVLVIAAPALPHEARQQLLSYGLLIAAAAAWAVSIVFVREHAFEASPIVLAPWQMLMATLLLFPFAFVIEGAPPALAARAIASLLYVGPVATAFAYWAIVEAGRYIAARTMSMTLLATPGLGIVISAVTLGEPIGASLLLGTVLIALGIVLATREAGVRPARGVPRGLRVPHCS